MSFVIDIKTRFIPEGQRIFMVFPGSNYRFYNTMKQHSVVFLDIPGVALPEDQNRVNDARLLKAIVVSERLKRWHLDGREGDKPTAEDVGQFRRTEARIQFVSKIKNFYYNIRKGDIIIVAGPTYDDEVLFGEITDESVRDGISVARYDDDEIPVRNVRWVQKLVRSKIPFWLEHKIPTPNPIQQIERDYFADVFDIMYQRYSYRDQFVCKYSVTSPEFSTLDNFLFQQILLYVAALYENNHDENIPNIETQSIATVVSRITFSEDIPDQRIQINSPGHIVVYSRNLIPLVAAVMMALCASGAVANTGHAPTMEIINSADASVASQECQADIRREVLDDITVMGYARWQELCQLEANTRGRTGLNSGISVRRQPRER